MYGRRYRSRYPSQDLTVRLSVLPMDRIDIYHWLTPIEFAKRDVLTCVGERGGTYVYTTSTTRISAAVCRYTNTYTVVYGRYYPGKKILSPGRRESGNWAKAPLTRCVTTGGVRRTINIITRFVVFFIFLLHIYLYTWTEDFPTHHVWYTTTTIFNGCVKHTSYGRVISSSKRYLKTKNRLSCDGRKTVNLEMFQCMTMTRLISSRIRTCTNKAISTGGRRPHGWTN